MEKVMATPVLSVIIPVYNQWPLTERCLLQLATHRGDLACEVIVVDNGSSDETREALDPLGE
ncbi:MAG: glycosyltransferase, partial [Desulfovibrio sp.]|nr:glycosyltransferase [Desulfovibrio sp.]